MELQKTRNNMVFTQIAMNDRLEDVFMKMKAAESDTHWWNTRLHSQFTAAKGQLVRIGERLLLSSTMTKEAGKDYTAEDIKVLQGMMPDQDEFKQAIELAESTIDAVVKSKPSKASTPNKAIAAASSSPPSAIAEEPRVQGPSQPVEPASPSATDPSAAFSPPPQLIEMCSNLVQGFTLEEIKNIHEQMKVLAKYNPEDMDRALKVLLVKYSPEDMDRAFAYGSRANALTRFFDQRKMGTTPKPQHTVIANPPDNTWGGTSGNPSTERK